MAVSAADMDVSTYEITNNPLWNLTATDPRCINFSCLAYSQNWFADQARYSNNLYPFYAQATIYFYCAVLAICIISYIIRLTKEGGPGDHIQRKLIARWRSIMYRRVSGRLGEYLDMSYGTLILLSIATIFMCGLPFYKGYYLRKLFRYGSPPLSVRSAFIISALLPVNIALSGKVNIITMMTGMSYARLNIWHRYVSSLIFYFSIIHLVPHFVSPVRDGGTQELAMLLKEQARELSGICLFFIFCLMIIFSFPIIRNRVYEFFKISHIILAVIFFALFFWHIKGENFSPPFFYVAFAILCCNFFARAIYRNRIPLAFKDFMGGLPTILEVLPGNMTRLIIQCPQGLQWSPGQHCYITIPGLSRLQAHPFTIVSLSNDHTQPGPNDMVILMKASKGFTKSVRELAIKQVSRCPTATSTYTISPPIFSPPSFSESSPYQASISASTSTSVSLHSNVSATIVAPIRSHNIINPTCPPEPEHIVPTRAWVDGPYGDFHPALERRYHSMSCIVGGSGITAALPWLAFVTSRMRERSGTSAGGPNTSPAGGGRYGGRGQKRDASGRAVCRTKNINLVWTVRSLDWVRWAERELGEVMRNVALANVRRGSDVGMMTGRKMHAGGGSSSTIAPVGSSEKVYESPLGADRRSMFRLKMCIFVTGPVEQDALRDETLGMYLSAGVDACSPYAKVELLHGRPDYKAILPNMVNRKKNMFITCGPQSQKIAVANTVAGLQSLVLEDKASEISLHSETFGW